jgi:S1-C subfamily serine protease
LLDQDHWHLILKNLNISVSEKDLRFAYSFNYDDFMAYKPSTFDQPISRNPTKRSLAEIEPAGKQLSSAYKGDTVKRILKQHHYYDTSGLLPDKLNTTFLEAELKELTIHTGAVRWVNTFVPMTEGLATVSLELKNYYGQKLAEKEIYAETGAFAPGRHGDNMDGVVGLIFKDALYTSIAKFMNKGTVQEHLQRESATTSDYETLVLERGDSINSLGEAKKATVTVQAGDEGHGSGFVIGKKGYVITNYHVVASESADSNLQVLRGRGQPLKADLIRKNANLDLALIKVDKLFDKTYRIPPKTEPERRNTAYAIGTPGSVELGQTLTKGIISGVRELDGNQYIQSDVSVNPGSSGGPLVNGQGHLLGVVSGKLTGIGTEGISFSLQAHSLYNSLGLQYKAE